MADFLTGAAGPILGASIDAISSIGGGLFSANQAKKNRAFQERMYNKQVEDNIRFWNMQNEYNLPSAQLQRLKDAGLNPLLMYGEGGLSGNLAQQAPDSGTAPHGAQASAIFHTAFGQALQQAALLGSQVRNIDADTESKLQDALLKAEETVRTREESGKIKSETVYNVRSLRDRVESVRIQNKLNAALADEPQWKIKEIQANIGQIDQNTEWIGQQIVSNKALTEQQIKESNQRIENSIKETAASVALMNQEARKAAAEALLADARRATENMMRDEQFELLSAEVRKAYLEGDALKIENAINRYIESMKPSINSKTYEWQKFWQNVVSPVTESLGKLLGGSATWAVNKR